MTTPSTIKDWENEVSTLTDKELADYETALETLATWKAFEDGFGPSKSLACLRQIISHTRTVRTVHMDCQDRPEGSYRQQKLDATD